MISTAKLYLLLSALATVESNNNSHAFNYEEQAYGILQVRQPVIDDVNRYCLKSYSIDDAFIRHRAFRIAELYLVLWCSAERQYSLEDAARIWNGGPEGWWKLSTLPYWRKVEAELQRRGLDSRATLLDSHDIILAWQPPQTKQSPAARSAFTLDTTAASSSRSDLATSFRFVWNASEATEPRSTSFTFTIKPSASRPARPPASPPPTSRPVQIHVVGDAFEFTLNSK